MELTQEMPIGAWRSEVGKGREPSQVRYQASYPGGLSPTGEFWKTVSNPTENLNEGQRSLGIYPSAPDSHWLRTAPGT